MSQPEWQVQKRRTCEADIVYLRTKTRKLIPVDAATVKHDDYEFAHGRHTSHFATCPDADKFRK